MGKSHLFGQSKLSPELLSLTAMNLVLIFPLWCFCVTLTPFILQTQNKREYIINSGLNYNLVNSSSLYCFVTQSSFMMDNLHNMRIVYVLLCEVMAQPVTRAA